MSKNNSIKMNTRDRLMRAWENSKELVRDFESYSKQEEDKQVARMFAEFAEDEGIHAARLNEILHEQQK